MYIITAKACGAYMDFSLVTYNSMAALDAYMALKSMRGAYNHIVFIGNTKLETYT